MTKNKSISCPCSGVVVFSIINEICRPEELRSASQMVNATFGGVGLTIGTRLALGLQIVSAALTSLPTEAREELKARIAADISRPVAPVATEAPASDIAPISRVA